MITRLLDNLPHPAALVVIGLVLFVLWRVVSLSHAQITSQAVTAETPVAEMAQADLVQPAQPTPQPTQQPIQETAQDDSPSSLEILRQDLTQQIEGCFGQLCCLAVELVSPPEAHVTADEAKEIMQALVKVIIGDNTHVRYTVNVTRATPASVTVSRQLLADCP